MRSTNSAEQVRREATVSAWSMPAFFGHSLLIWGLAVIVPLALATAVSIFHNNPAGAADAASAASIAWPAKPAPKMPVPAQRSDGTAAAPVDSLIAGLEQRLEQDPGDAKGWALLAQSHAFLGNLERAEVALGKAIELGFDEADIRHRVELAANAHPRPTAAGASASNELVRGVITIANAIPAGPGTASSSRLFVTARPTDGSTIPIAVLGVHVNEFPFEYAIGDGQAMMPGVKLSDYEEIALTARLSMNGTVERSEDDLESELTVVRVADAGSVDLILEGH